MDEPFSGLDSRLKDAIRSDTLAILREARVTAIIVTHDAEESMRMADRIALLKDGSLIQVGTSEDLYRHPRTLFAASFFSEINRLDGVVRDGRAQSPLGSFPAPGIAEGRPVDIAIRLSGVMLDERQGSVEARILSRRFLGVVDMSRAATSRSAPEFAPISCRRDCGTSPFPLTNVTHWYLKKSRQVTRS